MTETEAPKKRPLTTKQRLFVDEYIIDYNATQAAIRAGYSKKTAHNAGWQNVRKCEIREEIEKHVEAHAVGRNERLKLLSEIARTSERDSDRLNAIEKLGKLAGDYIDHKHINITNETLSAMSDGDLLAIIEE